MIHSDVNLGAIKQLVEWLSGGYKKDPHEPSPLIKLRVFNKRLGRQTLKMETQERLTKNKAIEARRNGDIAGSKIYMKNSLQYRKWANSTESFRIKLTGIEVKLDQAKVLGQFTSVAEDIVETLQGLQQAVNIPGMAKILSEMNLGLGNLEATMGETTSQLELTEDAAATSISEEEVNTALEEIDSEMSADSAVSLPTIPTDQTPEAQIDSLETEIKKLKGARKTT